MKIEGIPAGKEMDVLIVQKVMGYETSWWSFHVGEDGCEFLAPDAEGDYPVLEMYVNEKEEWKAIPKYSTNLIAALDIVRTMRKKDWYYCINWIPDWKQHHCCFWRFKKGIHESYEIEDRIVHHGFGETPELAICRAALLAANKEAEREH